MRKSAVAFHAAGVGLALALAGSASLAQQPAQPLASATTAPGSVSAGPEGAAAARPMAIGAGSDYTLGPGDKIRVIVYGETALSGEFFVSGAGKVSFPLIGDVPAASLTVQAFQQGLENGLRQGYLKEPRVSVEVLTYRPYYILGEVNKPGEYPYASGLTVLNAVATAGGFTYRAQTKRAFIRRSKEVSEKSVPLTSEVVVAPGDTIRISERLF